jgi:phosphoglycerate dehydrogenase-like enzyme
MVIYPAVDQDRLQAITAATGQMEVVQAEDLAAARREIVDAEAFLGKLTPELLDVASRLRWVQCPTASLEHYLFDALVEHDCTVTNMRGIYSDVIADQVMGYVLCFARNLHVYLRQQADCHWAPVGGEETRSDFIAGPGTVSAMDRAHLHLADCTMGIVGLGYIGLEIARRAASFSMRVAAVDPSPREVPPEVQWLGPPETHLDTLLADSDFLVIAAPHTPTSKGLFGRAQFRQMRDTAYLINIGRGAIVELSALNEALSDGQLAGAALDVFEVEPLPGDHPLWRQPNVIITPHMAASSPRIAERHLGVVVDNVGRFVRGEPLRNQVDKTRWC